MSGVHDPLYIEFISRLRYARKEQSLSQKHLGDRLGKDQTFVSKVETCERRLDVIEAAKWCAALGLCLKDVLPSEIKQKVQKEEEEI